MITSENIYEKGALINLKCSAWPCSSKLKNLPENLPKEIVTAIQSLLEDRVALDLIYSFDSETRTALKWKCIPHPINALYFIRYNRLEEADEYLKKRRNEREILVEDFIAGYETAHRDFKAKYPQFYRPEKYPDIWALRSKFKMSWPIIKIDLPNKELTPAGIYAEQVEEIKSMVDEMKSMVLDTITEEVFNYFGRLKDQTLGNGKPNQRTLNNTKRMLDQIESVYSDFIDDEAIRKVLAKLRKSIDNAPTADELRRSEDVKGQFGKEVKGLLKQLGTIPEIKAKRAIMID